MKKIYIAIVSTEDGEEYYYAYKTKPTENKVKNQFFDDHGENYEEADWKSCISLEMFDLKVL